MESVSEAFGRFLLQPGRGHSTKVKFRRKFDLFLERYGDRPVGEITAETISDWFRYLEERKGYSDGHLAFHRSCHLTFWRWLGRADVVDGLPRYSESPVVIVTASDADIATLLDVCHRIMWDTIQRQRDAAIVALGTAGLRRSNIERVRVSEARHALDSPVQHEDGSYYVLRTQGKQPMEAILDERRAAIVRRYLDNRPATRHDRLFVNLNEHSRRYLEPLSSEAYTKARRRVCKAAGLPVISFQQMRRWLGTKVARSNSIQVAAQALGHRSGVAVVLKHYYNPEKALTQEAVLRAYQR